MHLVSLAGARGGSVGARLRSGQLIDLARAATPGTVEAWLPLTMVELLDGGPEALDVVRRIVARAEAGEVRDSGAFLPANAPLLPVVPQPRLMLAAGLAYRSHLAEMSNTPAPRHPTAFIKSAASLGAPDAELNLPVQASEQVDYEGELACVIGRACYRASRAEALAAIVGLTIANDLSARDWVQQAWAATDPWDARLTWEVNLRGKQLPGFTPLGPDLVTMDDLGDVDDLRLQTRVNGSMMQDALIGDMIFPIDEIVSHLSQWYAFQPGDVVLTGTPAGVGIGRNPPMFLKSGDCVEVEVTRIGVLRTHIRDAA